MFLYLKVDPYEPADSQKFETELKPQYHHFSGREIPRKSGSYFSNLRNNPSKSLTIYVYINLLEINYFNEYSLSSGNEYRWI